SKPGSEAKWFKVGCSQPAGRRRVQGIKFWDYCPTADIQGFIVWAFLRLSDVSCDYMMLYIIVVERKKGKRKRGKWYITYWQGKGTSDMEGARTVAEKEYQPWDSKQGFEIK
ncbi:hypothetical protein BDN67DRAFT_985591, partial [Paxillus ammoniavirescens]